MLSDRPRIRGSVVAGYGEFLSRRSIGLEELLNKAGLPPSVLPNPDSGFPLNSVALLMELAAEAAGDPAPEFPRTDLEKLKHDISRPAQFKINFDYLVRRVKRREENTR